MGNYTVSVTLEGNDQLTPTLKNANRELGNMSESTDKTKSGYDSLKGAVTMFGAALAASQIAEKVVELYNLGTAANNAQNTFYQLSGGATAAEATLTKLRAATGGIVDDMTLMNGANKLFAMNLAQSGDEAAKLTELAVKLGGAMGNGAAESIENFSMMIANRSIERLDSFGIASGRVRERVEELKKSGMGMEEAFSFAVLEEGRKSLERLGSAAETSGAPVERMLTGINNLLQDVGQNVATAVNGLVGMAEIAAGTFPGQAEAEAAAEAAAMETADMYIGAFKSAIWDSARGTDMANVMEDFLSVDPQILNRMLQPAIDAMRANPELDMSQWVSDWFSANGMPVDWSSGIVQTIAAALETAVPAVESTGRYVKTIGDNAGVVTKRFQEALYVIDGARVATTALAKEQALYNQALEENTKLDSARESANVRFQTTVRNMADSLTDVQLMAGGDSIGTYMARDTANAIQAEFDAVQSKYEGLKEQFDAGLIGQDQLDFAAQYTDKIGAMASEAQKAADAFDRIKLSDLFGQQDGGMQGQVTDAVIQKMRDNGATPEQIQAMQDALDMQSGRQTGASQFFDKNIVPAMAGMKPEDAALLNQAYTDMMKQGGLAGLDPQGILLAQQKFMQTMFSGQGAGGGQAFTVKPGDTVSGLAMQYGMTPDQIMAGAGISNPRLLQPGDYATGGGGGVFDPTALKGFDAETFVGTVAPAIAETSGYLDTISTDTATFNDKMKEVTDQSVDLRDNIEALAAKTNTVSIELKLTGQDWEVIKQMGLMGLGAKGGGVRDNGGIVRGRDARVAE